MKARARFAAIREKKARARLAILPAMKTLRLYNHFLLTEGQRERILVVLVSPRNPLNIGAAARAMANFGFARLAVVAPFEAHWREARSAVGADELLQKAKVSATLAEAVEDCTLVAGTGTLTYRKAEQRVIALPGFGSLPGLGALVERELALGGRVALVFGPEKHGLTREALGLCHALVEIPTDLRQPSMNLGQAVAVCLYELAVRCGADLSGTGLSGTDVDGTNLSGTDLDELDAGGAADELTLAAGRRSAISGDLELLAGVVEEAMAAAHYRPGAKLEANRHELRLLLRRLAPTERDARRILGVFRRIVWRLRRKG
jgi:tRNA/rRNA methyltransferase